MSSMSDGAELVGRLPSRQTATLGQAAIRLSRAAFPTIVLGVGNKLLLVLVAAFFPSSGDAPFFLDLGSRLSWSVIVCGGLGAAMTLGRRRLLAAGLAGLVAAPIAFDLARAVRRGVVGYLQLVETSGSPPPVAIGALKGVEYACLGAGLSWLGRSGRGGAIEHTIAGLLAGIVFGGAILVLDLQAGMSGIAAILVWAVNELLFPVGCAFVLYRLSAVNRSSGAASATPLLR
jgi:hypothetical protein